MIERFLIAVVLAGFVVAHAFALHSLNAVTKDVSSSLAAITTIGD